MLTVIRHGHEVFVAFTIQETKYLFCGLMYFILFYILITYTTDFNDPVVFLYRHSAMHSA